MARSRRTAPRKRRGTTTAKRRTTAAAAPKTTTPAATTPAAPADTRLTKTALRSHVRRSKKPVFNLLGAFHRIELASEDGMDAIRRSMR